MEYSKTCEWVGGVLKLFSFLQFFKFNVISLRKRKPSQLQLVTNEAIICEPFTQHFSRVIYRPWKTVQERRGTTLMEKEQTSEFSLNLNLHPKLKCKLHWGSQNIFLNFLVIIFHFSPVLYTQFLSKPRGKTSIRKAA